MQLLAPPSTLYGTCTCEHNTAFFGGSLYLESIQVGIRDRIYVGRSFRTPTAIVPSAGCLTGTRLVFEGGVIHLDHDALRNGGRGPEQATSHKK